MREVRAIFRGQVQGVGFRATAKLFAERLELKGFVRNLEDGSVELLVQGEEEKLEQLLLDLKNLFKQAYIENGDVYFGQMAKAYEHFSISL